MYVYVGGLEKGRRGMIKGDVGLDRGEGEEIGEGGRK